MADTAAENMAQFDLTLELSKCLDRHLVFPLLEFLSNRNIYVEKDLERAKLELLQKTNMVDYAVEIYCDLHGTQEAPAAMMERRQEVLDDFRQRMADAQRIIAFLQDESNVAQLKTDKNYNLQFLKEHGITPQDITALYQLAKFQFECGQYATANDYLLSFRNLSTNADQNMNALWGMVASQVLQQEFEAAEANLMKLKEMVDSNTFAPILVQMQQRAWLLHWSLFVFFNHENGKNAIIDMFFQDRYLNTIQTVAPHLLRYLAVAVIINKRRRSVLKDLIRVVQQESNQYSDPITQFLECLFVQYDFEGAQQKLKLCEQVIENDFFLTACCDEFVENARLFIFETYCRIHQSIDLHVLANKLDMDMEGAEKWVVDLIREARLNAKIDSSRGTVNMVVSHPTVSEQIIEKTKGMSVRTFMLANAVVSLSRT